MAREIKTTIAVDGEQAFKRAINEASTSMKNLGTQLTLATAQFKKDGDAMKLAETRSKALNGQISQQEQIVKALEKAVEDSSKAYGENSAKAEKWEAELNRAKAKLINLQNELVLNEAGLNRNGKAFDESSEKAADYQATLQNIGKNVSFEAITKGLNGVTGLAESAITKVINLSKKLTEAMKEAASWADDIATEALRNQLTVEDQQRMEYASNFADTSVDTIMSARNRVINKMVKGWKNSEGVDMWEFLKIDTDTSRDPLDVMFELGDKLKNLTWMDKSIVRADEWSQEVFGKGFQDLLPLFNYGEENFRARMAEAPIVSDEDMKKLTDFQDDLDKLDAQLNALKRTALAELSPALNKIVQSLSGMLQQFNDWLKTKEGKEAMEELSAAIESLFSGLTDIDFSAAVNTVTDAITAIKNALVWISDKKNAQTIYDALKIIAAGFGLLEVAKLASNIGRIVTGFQGLKLFGNNGNNNTTSEPNTTGTDTTTGGGDGITGKGTGLLAAAKNAVNGKLLDLSSFANAFNLTNFAFINDWFLHQTETGRSINPEYGGSFSLENLWNGFWTSVNDQIEENRKAQEKYESGETWSILDPASKERHDKWVEQKEFEEKAREYHAEHTEPELTPEKWESMSKVERDLWMKTHPLPTQEEMNQEYLSGTTYWSAAPGAATEEKTPYEILQEIGGKLNDEQRTAAEMWWDEFRRNPLSELSDKSWDGLEGLFSDNESLLKELSDGLDNWFTDNTDQTYLNNEDLFSNALTQMRTLMESGNSAAEKIAGMDIKKFNSLPAEMQAAVQKGAASGVSAVKVQMDSTAVGRLVAPTVSAWIGERAQG